MAGLRFTLAFYGDTQIDRTLARFIDNVGDARPVWDALADRFVALERRQFASEGAYASGGWQALSPAYAAWKALHFPGKPILERTGLLKRSLTRRPLGIESLEPERMVIGSDVPYGRYHQRGGSIPQRRPVELPETERREWLNRIQRFIVTGKA